LRRIQAADDYKPKIVYSQVNWTDRNKTNKCQHIFYKFVRGFYISFYFYFFPFVTLLFSYVSTRCSEIQLLNPEESITEGKTIYGTMCDPDLDIWYAVKGLGINIFTL
jgi:hypothetical protein